MADDLLANAKLPAPKLLYRPFFIVCVAFGLRLLLLCWAWRQPAPAGPYGYEAGRIAESIASGQGFSSPLASVQTGPTAWLCPLFPYLMAGIFRIGGIFTGKSLIAIQILNCAFSSITILPIYGIAKKAFGVGVAVAACWLWVILPSAVHTPLADVWDTALTALLLAVIFFASLMISESRRVAAWAGYGALWGVGALVNAAMLSLFPFMLGWAGWRGDKIHRRGLQRITVAVGVCLALLLPWTVRNHRTFGAWIPLRSSFGLELWLGNNPDGNEVNAFLHHPFRNASEAAEFRAVGEIAYMNRKRHEAIAFMETHPSTTLKFIFRRILLYWFAVTDRPGAEWSSLPFYVKALLLPNLLMILLSWYGAVAALRTGRAMAWPFVFALVIFPLPYYLTHALVRYRFPLDPLLAILSVYGVATALGWLQMENAQGLPGQRPGVSHVSSAKGLDK